MIVALRSWYLARTLREQRLLLLMAAVAIPLLIWLLIVRPVDAAYEDALQRHLEATDRNGRVRALARAAQAGRDSAASPALPAELTLVTAESAAQAGLSLDANSAAGADSVSVSAAQASPAVALQWLRDLESRGLTVEEMRLVPGQPGTASLTARLARRR